MSRLAETVTVPLSELALSEETTEKDLVAWDRTANVYSPVQLIDRDKDGVEDALIFQVDMAPGSQKKIELVRSEKQGVVIDSSICAYSRFVPERVDDYTWENDRVAFRVYGPEAERLVKAGKDGGTLSSGIDCWLKRVSYPVIDKWYKMSEEGKGSYHVDHGEGLDNYHVGGSRGCGGIGVWGNDTLYTSGNYTEYQTLDFGPLRTGFEQEFALWLAGGDIVSERKYISLDLGSNLSRIEIQFESPYPKEIVAGLYIQDYDQGNVSANEKAGWFGYWSKHDDSELGIGIVVDPDYVTAYNEYRVDQPEKSHLFVHLQPIDGKVVYYTGFGWKKSGQFKNSDEWNKYLSDFSKRLASPLEMEIQ